MNKSTKTKVIKIIIGGTMILFLLNSRFPYIHIHKTKTTKQIQIKKEDDNEKDIKKPLTYIITSKEIHRDEVKNSLKDIEETLKPQQPQIQWINIIATFYTASTEECGNNRGITASGRRVSSSRGTIAAPSSIKLLSELYIKELDRTFVVEDRGNRNYIKKISDDTIRIDIYVDSKEKAKKLGVKHYKGYFVK